MGTPKAEARRQPEPRIIASTGNGGRKRRIATAVLVATYLYLAWPSFLTRPSQLQEWLSNGARPAWDDNLVDWDAIEPSEELKWVPCYRLLDNFHCARLTVPMDYNRPLNDSSANNPKVHVAMVMLPGKGHSHLTGSWSDSPLLVNPGGPGGLGSSLVLAAGRLLQTIAGQQHDIIGFDPRGIGATTPTADCFLDPLASNPPNASDRNTALLHRLVWTFGDLETGLPNSIDAAAVKMMARKKAVNLLCSNSHEASADGEGIFEYAGTPHVARDMLSIVKAWERWTDGMKGGVIERPEKEEETRSTPPSTRGKLVYWGFSYGTILGATFASMFPESVGRMVLDGVVNSDEWFFGNSWINAAEDSDKVLDKFFHYCHAAKERCHLWRKGDSTEDIKQRYDSIMAGLRENPRHFVSRFSHTPSVLTYSDMKRLTFSILYVPMAFPILSFVLDVVEREKDLSQVINPLDLAPMCGTPFKLPFYPSDGGLAVLCSDQQMKVNDTKPALDDTWQRLVNVSSFADVLFDISTRCASWSIPGADPPSIGRSIFTNGITATTAAVNTSFPLLFVSNTRDPITPLRSGLHQTQKFTRAGFIEQVSEGHCSIAAASLCTMRNIAAYFNEGVVPNPPQLADGALAEGSGVGAPIRGNWTMCEADEYPWKQPGTAGAEVGVSEVDTGRINALRELQSYFQSGGRFMQPPRMFEHLFEMDEWQLDELALRVYGDA